MIIKDLQTFLQILKKEGSLTEISCPVNPHLEAAEIHRRVIQEGGPALLFTNIIGADYPLVTNLFGTRKRVDLAFGKRPESTIAQIARLPHEMLPPSIAKLWSHKSLISSLLKIGLKNKVNGDVKYKINNPSNLTKLPLLTTWKEDGGGFITLPLVYTEHPQTHIHNLGMYRMQRYDDSTTGFHAQIGKGGGFHVAAAKTLGKKLPVNVFIGGPPALILSAIAPLPENVPELLLTSLVMGNKLELTKNPLGPLPLISNSEFALVGEIDPFEERLEGPFGDHYGYYSLAHMYPVFRCKGVLHRKNPVFTATVVGKPRQEDYYLGDYLQELLSPLFPLVMPAVEDLWSYGETGYHSLAAAVVKQRYKREAMVSAFRILGEGQLSLTKFLLVVDKKIDLKDFKSTLKYVLERADFKTDLYVFSNLSMDTLDYNGPKVNEGSKGILLGVGEKIREVKEEFHVNDLPDYIKKVKKFVGGCLVIESKSFQEDPRLADKISKEKIFTDWQLLVLADDCHKTVSSEAEFLWSVFTRFEPGADIIAKSSDIVRNHIAYEYPIVIDARKKPHLPDELECDEETKKLVDKNWCRYF